MPVSDELELPKQKSTLNAWVLRWFAVTVLPSVSMRFHPNNELRQINAQLVQAHVTNNIPLP